MKILLAWELGGGAGHVAKLAAVAEHLQGQGHRLILAVRDVTRISDGLRSRVEAVYQAPAWHEREPGLKPASHFAGVLFHVGYLKSARIEALIRAWLDLLDLVRPDALVVEHAPSLLLAQRLRPLPLAILGTGFTLPPNRRPLPAMTPWQPLSEIQESRLERGALDSINAALKSLGGQALGSLAEIFSAHPRFLCTWPELDHYAGRDRETGRDRAHYWGPQMLPKALPAAVWPAGQGDKVFVYLHYHYGIFRQVMAQLQKLGWPTLVVAPDAPLPFIREFETSTIKISPAAVDLESVAAQTRLALVHSPHGTVAELLRLGLAPVMVPTVVEQAMLAYRVADQGLGVAAGPDSRRHDYPAMLRKVLEQPQLGRQAQEFARRYQDYRYEDSAARLAEAVQAALV